MHFIFLSGLHPMGRDQFSILEQHTLRYDKMSHPVGITFEEQALYIAYMFSIRAYDVGSFFNGTVFSGIFLFVSPAGQA